MVEQLHQAPDLSDLAVIEGEGSHLLDLSARGWVDPAHLVAAASLAHAHSVAGLPLRVVSPRTSDQLRYAARMHLGRVLGDLGVQHDVPTDVHERDRREDLLEVRAVRDERDAVALAELVAAKVRLDSPKAADALFACLAEMAENVADHANAVGYVAAQTLPALSAIKFAVADAGTGVRAGLSVRGATTDRQALEMALSGVSRLDDPSRGTGLPTTVRVLGSLQGSLYLASGQAAVAVSESQQRRSQLPATYPGTLVQGVLRFPSG